MTKTAIWSSVLATLFASTFAGTLFPPSQPTTDADGVKARTQGAKTPIAGQTSPTIGHPMFASPHASPIAVANGRVYVANTPADTVDVIDAKTKRILKRIAVGVDPVGIAIRPDKKEVWVSNHVSDSVSVIDAEPGSLTFLQVIATVQDINPQTKATRFDEPVGIAFAGNDKAYVALSSENKIAVVNVATRKVVKRLNITAQDPRAIVVRNDRLYVIPFESNNQTQLSGGTGPLDGDLVTFNARKHVIDNNNVLSIGAVSDIIKHPRVPDRDLYVFDTKTDELINTVDTLGTLLYGLAVDSQGRVFIAQTDARNDVNGRAGTKKQGLAELENRAFLNRITSVPTRAEAKPHSPQFIDLEPLPPQHPKPADALATPFAIQVSADDSTLVVSAAASDKLFTVDAKRGKLLGRVDVPAGPRGIALVSGENGKAKQAWVLNALANSVSLVDLREPAKPIVQTTIALDDPTHPAVKRGRIAFNTARASTTGTFACASCHPDGHTDQLLWVLKTPIVTGGNQIMPRSTMPIRGLRDTAPFHWDGIPGDPYGGNNSANVHGSDPPNSSLDDPTSSTRHLIDGGLAATMSMVGDSTVNDEGKAGALTAAERDDMALFLLSVPYPPAQRRAYDNVVSSEAKQGFRLFHIDGDHDGKPRPNVCGNCHRMPFLVSTNTPGTGMDAPTWRGAYDRWLILPQGRLNLIDFDFFRAIAERGIPERNLWQFSWAGRRRFNPVWNMVLEGSTGFSGAFARQVTLNKASANDKLTNQLWASLEVSAQEGSVVLQAEGVILGDDQAVPVQLQFNAQEHAAKYVDLSRQERTFSRDDLLAMAKDGRFIGTFSARLGGNSDVKHPQPALWTLGPIERQRGRQKFPILHEGKLEMKLSGRHIETGAFVIVDGRRVSGAIQQQSNEQVVIQLESLPPIGMHLLQVQNPAGLLSNDFIFHVAQDAAAARELTRSIDSQHVDSRAALANAIAKGDVQEARKWLGRGARVNARRSRSGSTPLSTAALHGQLEAAELLIRRGADPKATNGDGNTPLHVAAFMCREQIVQMLLKRGASVDQKNKRGETPIDVVSGDWSPGLADFYRGIGKSIDQEIDLQQIQKDRPKIAELLREKKKADSK